MNYWTANQVLTQVAAELGLTRPESVTGLTDVQSVQLLAMLNSAGNELLMYYPWQQLAKEFSVDLVADQDEYDLPADYVYFIDQTQWDATNHWPLLGPKSAQQWAWLRNSSVASLPRMRYRIQEGVLKLYPAPASTVSDGISMEYISGYWIKANASSAPDKAMITDDSDVLYYDPWMLIKYIKLKFYELKGFNTSNVRAEFVRVFDALTGKDTGGEKLSLAPGVQQPYLGAWSVPDGSWDV
jgi:hypothetical protein